MATIDRVKNAFNPELGVEGIVLTMFDGRNSLTHQVADEVKAHFHVFDTIIPRNVKLSEAPSHGKPALLYDSQSKGAQGYLSLAREILDGSRQYWDEGKGDAARVMSLIETRRALGRGLDALLPAPASAASVSHGQASGVEKSVFRAPSRSIAPQSGQRGSTSTSRSS